MLPEATTERYLALIRRRLSRWRGHPQWEDIEGEAVLFALRALAGLPEAERETADALVIHAAGRGACDFARSPRNDFRRQNGMGNRFPPRLEIDALTPAAAERLLGVEPDFAPRVIRHLYARQVWADFWPLVAPADRPFMLGLLTGEETEPRAGTGAGPSARTRFRRAQRLLNQYRRRVGAPLYRSEVVDQEPVPAGSLLLSPADQDLARFTWYRHAGCGQVYRAADTGEQPKRFLGWEILARRDGFGRRPAEKLGFHQGEALDYRRENLCRLTVNEYKAASKRRRRHEQPGSPQDDREPASAPSPHSRAILDGNARGLST